MTVRVAQWATGSVGTAQLGAVLESPDLDLVGLFVYSPEKVGVDAGELMGGAPCGVAATDSREAFRATRPDVVLHAASKGYGENTNADDIIGLLAAGISVITTTSYNHLPTYGDGLQERIEQACLTGGSRFHAAGEHPGFMLERLAATLTGLSRDVRTITIQEFVDCSRIGSRTMLVELMGMGKAPAEISVDSPMFRSVSSQYEQSAGAMADILGLPVDKVVPSIEVSTSDQDVEVACGVLPAGTVTDQVLCWTAWSGGEPALRIEEHWTTTGRGARTAAGGRGGFLVRVLVEGSPELDLELVIRNGDTRPPRGTSAGQQAVAMTAVRAIPYVLAQPPGVVVAPVFGAYRWQAKP